MTEDRPSANDVETLMTLVRDRYGARLTAAQLEDVRKGVESIVQASRALRAVALQNADEPAQPFAPFRSDA